MNGYTTDPSRRYWVARYIRTTGRDLLLIVLYLPPGPHHEDTSNNTLQYVGLLIKHTRCPFLILGDWNQTPEELSETGFPNFVNSTFIHTNDTACTQGKGTNIDYGLCDHRIAHTIKLTTDREVPWSPHLGLNGAIHIQGLEDTYPTWGTI